MTTTYENDDFEEPQAKKPRQDTLCLSSNDINLNPPKNNQYAQLVNLWFINNIKTGSPIEFLIPVTLRTVFDMKIEEANGKPTLYPLMVEFTEHHQVYDDMKQLETIIMEKADAMQGFSMPGFVWNSSFIEGENGEKRMKLKIPTKLNEQNELVPNYFCKEKNKPCVPMLDLPRNSKIKILISFSRISQAKKVKKNKVVLDLRIMNIEERGIGFGAINPDDYDFGTES